VIAHRLRIGPGSALLPVARDARTCAGELVIDSGVEPIDEAA
jgi:hypothetical protein